VKTQGHKPQNVIFEAESLNWTWFLSGEIDFAVIFDLDCFDEFF
jgi:hypothetical protein